MEFLFIIVSCTKHITPFKVLGWILVIEKLNKKGFVGG
jgi:hypothetical protein